MATRRIISTEKTILDKDDIVGNSPAASQQSDIKPAVPTCVESLGHNGPSSPPPHKSSQCQSPLYRIYLKIVFSNTKGRDVIVKLLAFTFAMIVVPIGSYFATVHTVFKGELDSTPASMWRPLHYYKP